MAKCKAPVCLVRGDIKVFVNDVSVFIEVLASLDQQLVERNGCDSIALLASLSKQEVDTCFQVSGRHCSGLRDSIYHNRRQLSGHTFQQLQALNSAYSFLRHFSVVAGGDLLQRVCRELQGCDAVASPGSAFGTPDVVEELVSQAEVFDPTLLIGEWIALPSSEWRNFTKSSQLCQIPRRLLSTRALMLLLPFPPSDNAACSEEVITLMKQIIDDSEDRSAQQASLAASVSAAHLSMNSDESAEKLEKLKSMCKLAGRDLG
jgi:hypothetical protein